MTVNETIDELKVWAEMGYGDKPVCVMNRNREHVEVEEILPNPDGSRIEAR